MTSTITGYLDLITSEHADKTKFVAMVTALLQGIVDAQNVVASLPTVFDVDHAVGVQLDIVGQWVGRTRYLDEPLNVWFSWNVAGLGWGQGYWKGPFTADSGLVRLDDNFYRLLLYATIAANQWDGTIPSAYNVLNTLFVPLGYQFLIQDNGDMTMLFALKGPALNALVKALFTTGMLDVKPAGVGVKHVIQSIPGSTPFFGWGVENSSIKGWGEGAWGVFS